MFNYNDRFEKFTLTLADILKMIKKLKDRRMGAYGLRSSHVMVLYLLGRSPQGLTPAELSELGSVDKALISRVMTELSDKGFIVPNSADGRRYKTRVILTPLGQETATYIASAVDDIQRQVSADIPPEDLATFYRTLYTLQENFHRLVDSEEEA